LTRIRGELDRQREAERERAEQTRWSDLERTRLEATRGRLAEQRAELDR
jgi:hypothetical protein